MLPERVRHPDNASYQSSRRRFRRAVRHLMDAVTRVTRARPLRRYLVKPSELRRPRPLIG